MEESEASEEKALREAFQKFDIDGDGKIQKEEFGQLMKAVGNFSSKEIGKLFIEADSDGSGSVDWREFIKWISSGKATEKMDKASAVSFSRLLKQEVQDEASFVEQALVSRQTLSYLKEADQDRCASEVRAALKRKQIKAHRLKESSNSRVEMDNLGIPSTYTGFRLPVPVTEQGAKDLLNHFLVNGESSPLHPKYVSHLTTEFTNMYRKKHPDPVARVSTPPSGRLIIVGDTHGQLADVLHIMHQLGTPSANNVYLFNGDIADRGHQSVEIFMILFAFFLADPSCILINRGNHENEDMNALDVDSGGGFQDEVSAKYGLAAYRRFATAFRYLSLCAVVQQEIFVVHGGLSRVKTLTIEYINSIEHTECTAPHPTSIVAKDQVFSDLLWADPSKHNGKFKSDRGIGIKFGPDITLKFCMTNRLRFIVRSHQVPDDGRGYEKLHDGRCVTVFSASNYCGTAGNYGAVLVLASEHFPKYEIYEHYAYPLSEMSRLVGTGDQSPTSADQRSANAEAANKARKEKEHAKMVALILEKKPTLWAHLVSSNMGSTVNLDTWADMMSEFVEGNLPWKEAAESWGIADKAGNVEMGKFLGRWVVTNESEQYTVFLTSAVKHVFETIMLLDMDLEQTLKLFDTNNDGTIELKEFRQVLGMFDLGLTHSQLDRFAGQIFTDVASSLGCSRPQGPLSLQSQDAPTKLSVQDFLGRFTMIYKHTALCDKPSTEPWVLDAFEQIGRLMIKTPATKLVSDLDQAVLKIQKIFRGGQGRQAVAGIKNAKGTPAPTPTAKRKSFASKPLSEGLKATSHNNAKNKTSAGDSELALLQGIPKIAAIFSALDSSGDGILQVEEFVTGIEKLPGVNKLVCGGRPLTHDRLIEMAKAMDTSGNGTINYLEWLKAFRMDNTGSKDIEDTLSEDVTTLLFRHRLAIRMGCVYLDEEATGRILATDFMNVLQGVSRALTKSERALTRVQIELLVEAMSVVSDDDQEVRYVDYDGFLRAFVIFDTERQQEVVKRSTFFS